MSDTDTDSDFETGATGRKLAECQQQLANARMALCVTKQQLAEALAALRDNPIEIGRPMYAIDAMEWLEKHAAALKAAREQS